MQNRKVYQIFMKYIWVILEFLKNQNFHVQKYNNWQLIILINKVILFTYSTN